MGVVRIATPTLLRLKPKSIRLVKCPRSDRPAQSPPGCSDSPSVQRLAEIETVTINLPGGRDFDCAVIAVAGATAALKPYGFATAKLNGRIDGVLLSFVYERR